MWWWTSHVQHPIHLQRYQPSTHISITLWIPVTTERIRPVNQPGAVVALHSLYMQNTAIRRQVAPPQTGAENHYRRAFPRWHFGNACRQLCAIVFRVFGKVNGGVPETTVCRRRLLKEGRVIFNSRGGFYRVNRVWKVEKVAFKKLVE